MFHSQKQLHSNWLSKTEGELHVDVSETKEHIIVRTAIAGVSAKDLDISITEDTLTIKGERHLDETTSKEHVHIQECHWGSFSRSVILPSHVDVQSTKAELKKGILTIVIKKKNVDHKIEILEWDDV